MIDFWFLNGVEFRFLTEDDSIQLAEPITLEELKAAALDMQRGKAPGWDGIPPRSI